MPNDFNGNDVPAPEKSKKRKSTPKARKSAAVSSDGAAATPAPMKTKSSQQKSTKILEPAAPEVKVPEVVVSNLSTMPASNSTYERIRVRAYEIYIERGGQHGFDQADWLRAETEILGRRTA